MIFGLIIQTFVMLTVTAQHNLTPTGTSTQSSSYRSGYKPQYAINPPMSNRFSRHICSHTYPPGWGTTPAWWMFELSFESAYITDIIIYYRKDFAYRMDGYKLYVTNTATIPPDGYLCYEDPDHGYPNITQTIPCNHLGKYVIYYDTKGSYGVDKQGPIVELCYVAINGCQKTFWGVNCETPCAEHCVERHCYPGNGSCVLGCIGNCLNGNCYTDSAICIDGCKTGWTGTHCNKSCSTVGRYGKNCLEECSENCLNPPCNHVTGECIGGCNNGWLGFNCTQKCPNGQFGILCSKFCNGCISNMCDHVDGLCENTTVCNPGYVYEKYCKQECDNWYFGNNCSMECNCLAEPCNKVDGKCPIGGCKDGWHGESCNQQCIEGHFGRNCNRSCDGCISKRCEATDGLCYNDTGCEPGYYFEDYCNKTCDDWYFGTNCTGKCNCLTGPCSLFTGKCPDGGCKKGWHGESCEKGCNELYFGRNCNRSCDGCISNRCEATDGLCLNTTGCEPGYYFEEYCNKTCDDWYFGNNCTRKFYCLTEPCSRVTGKCQSGGCQKGWQGDSCEEAISELQKEDPPYAATIGGGATAVILILLIVVIFVIYRRRSVSSKDRQLDRKSSINETSFDTSKKPSNIHNYANIDSIAKTKEDTSSLTESEETESQIVKIDDMNVYGNVLSVSKYKTMIGDLKVAIHEKQKGEDFEKEYATLQKGLLYPHVEGSKEENKVKNRFLSLWPYDHARVVLKGDTAHDYINASYIDNYEKEKAYIAAQGPKNETLRDFWHMIWQENVGKIVMVTQIKENRKIKCAQYWPKSVTKPLAVNNYIVTMKEERKHTVYVYRLLTLLNKNDTIENERKIHHFHFTQWPDHGVPDSIKLVSFYRKVKIEKSYQNGPMVVHCSAGVGRTGTFIAIDALYENGKNVGYVNVMECIEMMRKDRMNMVQTYEQYEAVFEALLELFNVPETSIPKTDFCKYISDQEHKTVPRNQNMYKVEFQRLEALRPLYPQSAYTAATSLENIHKNSAKKIFPHDKYRPYLMSYGKTRNDYINAVIVPGYIENSKLLVTQCPLEKTVVDFWTMIYDHQSNIVVLLDQLNMNAPLWLEQQEVLEFEQFSIVQENASSSDELQLTLTHKNQGERRITVFTLNETNGTSDTMFPSNIILDLLKNVNDCWEENKGPITVVCSDGCSKSGIFLALRLILEKIAIDDEIDVFQVVRTIQVRRPEFLMNFHKIYAPTKTKAEMLFVLLIQTTFLFTVTAQHNLTPFGKASHSKDFGDGNYKSEYAIQPPISNKFNATICSHTYPQETPAWWMFQFAFGSAYVTNITIYYRENFASRMDGFQLYVTNTSTIPPDGHLCYADTDPGYPNIIQNIPCNQLAQYVIYYDNKGIYERRILKYIVELCYVAIIGCQKSHWGSNCENVCADKCIEQNCYPGNGSCVWGCDPKNCLNDVCNKDTAVCTDGCKKRRTGSYCNKYNVAFDGMVSLNPSGSPPASLANDGNKASCSKSKGINITLQVDLMNICIGKGMYVTFGEHIQKDGLNIVYASNNSHSWSIGTVLYNERSVPLEIKFNAVFRYLTYVFYPDQDQPSEIELCEIGIYGCPPSRYGHFCNTSCPQNCQGPCDVENGLCIFGCSNGWTGSVCEHACQHGHYGHNCLEKCSTNCITSPCNHVTGGCNGDCKDGWQGFNCFEKCPHSQFGKNCSQFCKGCLLGMCDPVNGLCNNTSICSPGYIYGEYCNIACDDGYFGNNCTRLCNCVNGYCSAFTGNCPDGCAKGWRGEACDKVSEESSQAGAVGGGVSAVIIVLIMVTAIIVYKRRFISTKAKENNTDKIQSHQLQHYDNVQKENESTYQDLMTRPTSNVYDQINTACVHH